ncbi:hypothetical protein [Sulfurisphaera ohwakuensis]|uniref:hypothetical protein n=1 Tax=Sulfurisphaera ohwakuensis TaxID=69656 RepID=UPI0036F44461
MSDFSFDGFKLLADRASRKDILVRGAGGARFPVEGSGLEIRKARASATTLAVIQVFFLNLYLDLVVLSTRIRC